MSKNKTNQTGQNSSTSGINNQTVSSDGTYGAGQNIFGQAAEFQNTTLSYLNIHQRFLGTDLSTRVCTDVGKRHSSVSSNSFN